MSDVRDRSLAVQFYTIEDTVEAYRNMNVPAFAIWHRKQPLFPFDELENVDEGVELLYDFLKRIKSNGSNATYTLCIYREIPEKGIDSKTPFRASYNFNLNAGREEDGYTHRIGYGADSQAIKILQDQITALQLKNEQLETQLAEGEDDPGDGMGAIGTLLNHPLVKLLTDRLVGNLVNNAVPEQPQQQRRPAVMNGIQQQTDEQRLVDALQVLKENDPDLINHLYKLASLSQTDANGFKMLLGMLDKM